jgi:DNA polymerase elongation subunit (family B)
MDVNIFIGKPEDFKLFFRRMIDLLLEERREFREKMNE